MRATLAESTSSAKAKQQGPVMLLSLFHRDVVDFESFQTICTVHTLEVVHLMQLPLPSMLGWLLVVPY